MLYVSFHIKEQNVYMLLYFGQKIIKNKNYIQYKYTIPPYRVSLNE
jgi:hypothetical protein